jgi:hypothetical protein
MDKTDWISVKDKLPFEGQPILMRVLNHRYHWVGAGQQWSGLFFKKQDGSPDWLANGFYVGSDNHCEVTHWMPLPELPDDKT